MGQNIAQTLPTSVNGGLVNILHIKNFWGSQNKMTIIANKIRPSHLSPSIKVIPCGIILEHVSNEQLIRLMYKWPYGLQSLIKHSIVCSTKDKSDSKII